MKILQVAAFPFPSPQGSQVYVRGMARALARRGHDVSLLCYGHGEGEVDKEYRVLRTPDLFGYRNMRAGPDWVKPVLDMFLMKRLLHLRADIIHVHNYEAPLAAILTRWKHRTPIVYSAHNTMEEELPVYFSRKTTKKIARKMGAFLDRSIPRRADHAIAIRPETVDRLVKLGCDHVSCVLPGVSLEDIQPCEPAELPHEGPWVIYAGNLDAYQDLDVLFEAMGFLPEIGLLLVSSNNLSRRMRKALQKIQKLHCVQSSDFQQVRSYLAAADIAVIPRTVCSGFPIKLLNYMGMSLPVVAAKGAVESMPGVVHVDNHDPFAMALAIRQLVQDQNLRRAMGTAGKNHILENWTWEVRAIQLENIYNETLQRHFLAD